MGVVVAVVVVESLRELVSQRLFYNRSTQGWSFKESYLFLFWCWHHKRTLKDWQFTTQSEPSGWLQAYQRSLRLSSKQYKLRQQVMTSLINTVKMKNLSM